MVPGSSRTRMPSSLNRSFHHQIAAPDAPGRQQRGIGRDGAVPGDPPAAGAGVEPEPRTCPRHPAGETPRAALSSPSPPSTLKYANSNGGGFLHIGRARRFGSELRRAERARRTWGAAFHVFIPCYIHPWSLISLRRIRIG